MKPFFMLLEGVLLSLSLTVNAQSSSNANWITSLNDNLYISQLSLPGAHDAATKGVSVGECQTITLEQLWDAGVRVFDLRPTDANNCPIYHGSLSTGINLTQALTTITGRLQSNNQEFAIILMRNENDNGSTDNWKSRVTAIMNNFSSYVKPFNNNLRLGDVRGKVVVLSRDYFADGYTIGGWGGDPQIYEVFPNDDGAFRFHVQDYYKVGNSTSKQNVIKSLLDEARTQTSPNFMFINHTSGYSGLVSTNSNISSNAKTMNKCALDYINANPGRTGIIMMDHAGSSSNYGADLCNAIIAQNGLLSGLNLQTLPDNTDYFLQNVETGLWLQGNTGKTTTSRDGWNTAANMGSYGRPFRIKNYDADGYTLNTQSGPNALGCNYGDASLLYLDGSIGPSRWKFTGTRDAAHITVNWDRWLSVDGNNRLVNSNSASTWRIWTREERLAAMANATPENPQDVTWLMVNPELMNNDNMTPQWTISRSGGNQGWQDGFRPNRVFETWSFSNLDFYQTINDLPNGHYRVRAHAMYSPTGIGNTSLSDYNSYVSNGEATVFAALYANDQQVKLPSIYSFTNATQVADYTYRNLGSGVNIVDGWWQIARAMGEDDKFFTEPLDVVVSDGTLRLGVKSLSGNPSSNWVLIGSFSLEYLGVDRITLDEEATSVPASSGYAHVTLNRAFNQGWNAVCLPFDVPASSSLLAGAEIAQFNRDVNTDGHVELQFTTTDRIVANTPYLVYFPQAVSKDQVFEAVNFNPQEVKVVGTTFDFMGTYTNAAVVSAGDYVISNGKLAKASTAITLKGTRTYFKLKTAAPVRSLSMTIDDEDVSGIGQLFIDESSADTYNLQGQKVNGRSAHGVYIQKGKKIVK